MKRKQPTREKKLITEIEDLRRRLEEAEQTLDAIRQGEVDALVISGPQGDHVYTLEGAEHPYRILLESMNEGAITMTPEGSIIYCNNRFIDLVKAPPRIINSSIYDLFLPTDHMLLTEILQKKGKSEISIQAKDGTSVPVYLSCTSVELDGAPSICMVVTDLTEQKRNEEKKTLEKHYQRIFQDINEGALIFGFTDRASFKDGLIIYANNSFATLVKRPLSSVIGGSIFQMLREEDTDPVKAMLREIQYHGRGTGAEIYLKRGNGELVNVNISTSMLQKAVMYAIVTDLTEIKKREREAKRLASELITAQEKERKRIANELHDGLAADLAATKMGLENKLKSMVNNTASEFRIEDLITRLQANIVEVRRIMTSLHPSLLDDLGISATIKWYCREYQKTYPHINTKLEVNISESEVSAPLKTAIYRICQESLNNIAKHSRANSVILSLRKSDKRIKLSIQDNGRGLGLNEKLKVKNHIKGLGLDSMRERTEILGGSFSIESSAGAGTTIHASWPV